jgi:serine/threonine-protein kinase
METWRDVPVLVVEYLPGGTLAQRLEAPWDALSVLELGAGLASGLTALHATGLAHRDIKPSNIAFAADGTPKLLDFGLTRRASAPSSGSSASGNTPAPAASSAAGTPLYLSPELLRGEDTPLAEQDLWALSVLLCEVLAGRHPLYLGDGDPMERLSRGEVLPREPRSSGHDEDVAALLARCLSPDRGQRPASAAVLLDDLKGLLAARAG